MRFEVAIKAGIEIHASFALRSRTCGTRSSKSLGRMLKMLKITIFGKTNKIDWNRLEIFEIIVGLCQDWTRNDLDRSLSNCFAALDMDQGDQNSAAVRCDFGVIR